MAHVDAGALCSQRNPLQELLAVAMLELRYGMGKNGLLIKYLKGVNREQTSEATARKRLRDMVSCRQG